MDKDDYKGLKRGWGLTIAGVLVAFFAGISANGAYDYLRERYHVTSVAIFLIFGVLTIVAISYLSFFINHAS